MPAWRYFRRTSTEAVWISCRRIIRFNSVCWLSAIWDVVFWKPWYRNAPKQAHSQGCRTFAAARFRRASLALLAAVVLFYQAAGTLGEWALAGSFHTAVQDFRIGLPGMLLQIFGGWAFINFIIRK